MVLSDRNKDIDILLRLSDNTTQSLRPLDWKISSSILRSEYAVVLYPLFLPTSQAQPCDTCILSVSLAASSYAIKDYFEFESTLLIYSGMECTILCKTMPNPGCYRVKTDRNCECMIEGERFTSVAMAKG
jgi:hypothetical protein